MGHSETFGSDVSNLEPFSTVYVNSLRVYPTAAFNISASLMRITVTSLKHYIHSEPVNYELEQFAIPDNGIVQISSTNPPVNTMSTDLTGTDCFINGEIARLNLEKTNVVSNVNDGVCFNLSKGAAVPGGVVALDDMTVQSFSAIGTIDGLNLFAENIGWVRNGAGLTLNNMALVQMAEQNFGLHSGDHITLTGTLREATFDRFVATPSTGDAVFNIDSSLSITNRIVVSNCLFSDAAGGTLFAAGGLDQTDIRVVAFNNGNAPDSRWIAEIGFEGNTTDTSLSKDTPADISGTFTTGTIERHTRSGGVTTYIGLEDITENITVSASIENGTGGGKRDVQMHLLVDTGSGFAIVATHNASMSREVISLSFTKAVDVSTGAKYKAQVENIENNDDMLVIDLTIIGIKA